WYVVGFDRDRKAIRAFRADRIEGDATIGERDAFEPPADFRPDDHVEARGWLLGDDPAHIARLAVDNAHRDALLGELGGDATIVDENDECTIVELVVTNRAAFRTFMLGFLEH